MGSVLAGSQSAGATLADAATSGKDRPEPGGSISMMVARESRDLGDHSVVALVELPVNIATAVTSAPRQLVRAESCPYRDRRCQTPVIERCMPIESCLFVNTRREITAPARCIAENTLPVTAHPDPQWGAGETRHLARGYPHSPACRLVGSENSWRRRTPESPNLLWGNGVMDRLQVTGHLCVYQHL